MSPWSTIPLSGLTRKPVLTPIHNPDHSLSAALAPGSHHYLPGGPKAARAPSEYRSNGSEQARNGIIMASTCDCFALPYGADPFGTPYVG